MLGFRWILTAGHCLSIDNITVFTDIQPDGEYKNRIEIAEKFIHSDYTINEAEQTTTNDIGSYTLMLIYYDTKTAFELQKIDQFSPILLSVYTQD